MKFKQGLVLPFLLMLSGIALSDTENEWDYPMQPGESVWSIAHELLTDWRDWKTIERLNNVRNDKQMLPGTVLKIPRPLIKEYQSDIIILDVSGVVTAQVVMNDGSAKAHLPLVRGQSLGQGDQIKTSSQSTVLLEFDDGTQVLILENSLLKIKQATVVGNTRKVVDVKVFLEEGEAEIRANPAKVPGSQFLIDTPVAFATTRGTTYRIRAAKENTAAEVIEGHITVKNTLGGTAVWQGYGSLTKVNEPPARPQKLLPEPELPDLSKPINYLPGKLEWSELEGAVKYRGQISPDPMFTTITYDSVSAQPKMGLPATLKDQVYWLRVSAISEEGLQGFSSAQKINIAARPFPPVRQAPRSSDLLYSGDIDFAWSRPDLAASFRIDIALDERFETLVLSQEGISETHFTASITNPGRYFWRVSSMTSQGGIGPLGFAGQFTVKPVPPKPELKVPMSSENEMFFSWNSESDIQYYQLQFAKDREFKQLLVDKNTPKSELAIEKPEPGTYYIRVRAFDADDYAGEWTAAQQVEQPIDNWWPVIFSGAALLLML